VIVMVWVVAVPVVRAGVREAGGTGGALVEAARFKLPASAGFTAAVDASGQTVVLTVERRLKHRLEVVQYTVPGQVTTHEVSAEFGALGSIDVSFQPTGPAEQMAPPAGCDGYYVPGQVGTFSGVIRFRGEGGFVSIDAARARGEAGASDRWSCGGGGRRPGHPGGGVGRSLGSAAKRQEEAEAREYGHLSASSRDGRFFRAVGGPDANGRYGPAFFLALSVERSAPMKIIRELALEDRGANFKFDERLRSAAVRPPAPFQGQARYQQAKGGAGRWSGSLRVLLPGAANVPLVGAGFTARLSHDLPGD